MRVAFFTDTFSPTINGVVTSIVYYANELVAHGHEVMIIAPKNREKRNLEWGLDDRVQTLLVSSVDARFYPDVRIGLPSIFLLDRVREFNPDLIHTFTPFILGLDGLIIAKRLKKFLAASHMTNYTDDELIEAIHHFPKPVMRYAKKGANTLLRWFLNAHQAVLVPSAITQDEVLEMGIMRPISILRSPVDVQALQKGMRPGLALKKRLGLNKTLLYVGRLSGEKHVDLIIKAFAGAQKLYPQLKLVIIGDGTAREELFSLAAKVGVNKSIVWVGSVPHEQLIREGYFYLGDIFVTLSEFETQGLSTVEAFVCGLPVIGANARATKEIVKNVGLLVSANKSSSVLAAIKKILNSNALANELSARSLMAASEFSTENCYQSLMTAYEQVTNQSLPVFDEELFEELEESN